MKIFETIKKVIIVILSISGFVIENLTAVRMFFMLGSVYVTMVILPKYAALDTAICYFIFSTIAYLVFIFLVLPKNGLRLKLIEKFGEEDAYKYYEGFLAFAFFHNGFGLSFISQSSIGTGFWGDIDSNLILAISVILFLTGFIVKIWSAYVVGIPIYYWKDMFLGRKICEFVESGPYKYLSNPMYGVGQVQVYAIAIYYNSIYGILFAFINQALVFLFYYTAEKPFINRVYLSGENQ